MFGYVKNKGVTFSCGHRANVPFSGNRDAADRYGAGRVCPACWEEGRGERLIAANADAATWGKTHQLPALTGTEKQIAWAESLRRKDCESVGDFAKGVTVENFGAEAGGFAVALASNPLYATTWLVLADLLDERNDSDNAAVIRAVGWILEQSAAAFWIDNRRDSLRDKVRGRLTAVKETSA